MYFSNAGVTYLSRCKYQLFLYGQNVNQNLILKWVQDSCRFVGKQTVDRIRKHTHSKGLDWCACTMQLSLMIAMVAMAQFSQTADSRCSADDWFSYIVSSGFAPL